MKRAHNFRDITEQKFGKLSAIKHMESRKGSTYWLFKCDCGKEKIMNRSMVTRGLVTHCGCSRPPIKYKYGFKASISRFYNIFQTMRNRCNRPNHISYDRYGAKGIRCLWPDFGTFKKDMHESYNLHVKEFGEKNTTIDRINSKGHYCKENCRWATLIEQANNASSNRHITFNGETLTFSQWVRKMGITESSLRGRIERGWSLERALTTPVRRV